jgi:hypothetical protein
VLIPQITDGLTRAETAYCLGLSTSAVEAVELSALTKVAAALRHLDLDADDLLDGAGLSSNGRYSTAPANRHA